MATTKKPMTVSEEPSPEEPEEPVQAAPEEPVQADPSPPVAGLVCAVCGLPATRVSASNAYSPAYYCDSDHGMREPLKAING